MNTQPHPIVLIPGYMLDAALWREFETYLPEQYLVQHAAIGEGSTMREIARHMATRLPEKFTLIGFSLGGYIARQLAADFPERVASLVLIASSLREDTPAQRASKLRSIQALSPDNFHGLSRSAIARSLHPQHAARRETITLIQQMGARLGFEAFVNQSTLSRSDIPAVTLRCPTLVIASAEDAMRSQEEVKELADAIPNAQLKTIGDSGHMLPLEQPQRLAAVINDWLEKIKAERATQA
ncbi:alpha/beta hydrolase [Salmonella enterica subsp. enterica serovar Choleraesuis]|nr:alpha/beta hydrolase [Salmonella enterica subsp. enterica serovar Choleraesuis]